MYIYVSQFQERSPCSYSALGILQTANIYTPLKPIQSRIHRTHNVTKANTKCERKYSDKMRLEKSTRKTKQNTKRCRIATNRQADMEPSLQCCPNIVLHCQLIEISSRLAD